MSKLNGSEPDSVQMTILFFDRVWNTIKNMFNQATGQNKTTKQLRTLFQRLKDQSKKVLQTFVTYIFKYTFFFPFPEP